MNRLVAVAVSAVLSIGMSSSKIFAAAEVGKPAPEFTLPASDGKGYNLADYKGKFVVLEWYNPECPFVKKHYGSNNMQKLQETYLHKGVVWLTINSSALGKQGHLNAKEAVKDRVENKLRSSATLLDADGKVGKLYGAKTTPHMYVINPKGEVIYMGAIDNNNSPDASEIPNSKNYVAAALDEAMAGKAVTTASSTPYGCSIKYKN